MENNFKKKQVKCIISGGKTGGHLIPGIAVYETFKKRGFEVVYILNSTDVRFPVVTKIAEEDRIYLDISSISRKLSFKTIVYIFKLLSAFVKIFGKIISFNPDFVVITGGYISNPVALSSVLLLKPLYILEQNSVAGITNRFFSLFARKIFTSFETTLKIPYRKSEYAGNPILCHKRISRIEARQFFGVDIYEKVIGIISGSQGARFINSILLQVLPELEKRNTGVIWSAGVSEYNRLNENGELESIKSCRNIKIFPFIEEMNYFYSAIDIVISRAGATSISEIIYFNVPGLFIPIKNSPDRHQELNASFLVNKGVAFMINEDEMDEKILLSSIEKLFSDIEFFRENFKNFKKPKKLPQEFIADEIIKIEGAKWQY